VEVGDNRKKRLKNIQYFLSQKIVKNVEKKSEKMSLDAEK